MNHVHMDYSAKRVSQTVCQVYNINRGDNCFIISLLAASWQLLWVICYANALCQTQ